LLHSNIFRGCLSYFSIDINCPNCFKCEILKSTSTSTNRNPPQGPNINVLIFTLINAYKFCVGHTFCVVYVNPKKKRWQSSCIDILCNDRAAQVPRKIDFDKMYLNWKFESFVNERGKETSFSYFKTVPTESFREKVYCNRTATAFNYNIYFHKQIEKSGRQRFQSIVSLKRDDDDTWEMIFFRIQVQNVQTNILDSFSLDLNNKVINTNCEIYFFKR